MGQFFDYIIVGAGAMGSATAWALRKQSAKVLVLERFHSPHAFGSSHGESRLIRKAYFEHPSYVPLLHRAYELWDEIQAEASTDKLFIRNGLVVIGKESDAIVKGICQSAEQYDLDVRKLAGKEVEKLYPTLKVPKDCFALYEPGAGLLQVEKCIAAQIEAARGVEFHWHEPAVSVHSEKNSVRVQTHKGNYECGKLIVTNGAWLPGLLPIPNLKLEVRRVPLFWFQAPPAMSLRVGMPCFAYVMGEHFFYGFPDFQGTGVKIAEHKGLELVANPSELSKEIKDSDLAPIREFMAACLPSLPTSPQRSEVCMYTLSPDHHFVIDFHPESENIVFASACSGHGFKFSPVIGEILSDLATTGESRHEIDFLRNQRSRQKFCE